MKLRTVFEKGFDHIGGGQFNSVSILDREGETIKVVSIDEISTVDESYLDAEMLSVGSSTLKPDRIRIRIDVLR